MIFNPGLPTESEQEITAQELICGFVISLLGNTQPAIHGHLVTSAFAVQFEP